MELKEKLRNLINEHGAVKVSFLLGVKDSRTVQSWAYRAIPKHREELIKKLIKKGIK